MAGRYLGIGNITFKGKVIKTNDIIDSMTVKEAKARKQFEPVKEIKPETPKNKKGDSNEREI